MILLHRLFQCDLYILGLGFYHSSHFQLQFSIFRPCVISQRSDLIVQILFHGRPAKEDYADGKKDKEKSHLLLLFLFKTALSDDER